MALADDLATMLNDNDRRRDCIHAAASRAGLLYELGLLDVLLPAAEASDEPARAASMRQRQRELEFRLAIGS